MTVQPNDHDNPSSTSNGEASHFDSVRAEISREMVRLYKELFGRGPTKARTEFAGPDIVSRGFVFEDEAQDFLNEAEDRVEEALRTLEHEKVTDWQAIKKAVRRSLGEYVWQETRRRPMIMPIVTEV